MDIDRVLKVAVLLGITLTTGQSGACVSQCSVRPTISVRNVHPASGIAVARWSHEVDPRYGAPPRPHGSVSADIAANAGTVVVADNGGLTALDATTGRERWRTAVSHLGVPVIVGDVVVAANAMRRTGAFDGAVRTIDAFALRDGTARWRVNLPTLKPQPPSNPPYAPSDRYLPPVAVATADNDFLVSTQIDAGAPYQYSLLLTELDVRGARRWSRVLAQGNVGRIVAIRDGIAYLAAVEDGSIISDIVRMVRLGRKGGFLGMMTFAIGPITWDTSRDPMFENAFPIGSTRFAVESVPLAQFNENILQRVQRTTWTFAPDGLPGSPGFGDAGIENGFVYGLIHDNRENGAGRLYRYRLAAPDQQRPLLLGNSITAWVAGPTHAWNIVDEGGELVALRERDNNTEVQLQLAHYASSTSIDASTFDGHRLYVGRYDGRVQGFDLDAATTILDAPTRCIPDASIDRQHAWRSISVRGNQLIAVCAHRAYAFALKPVSAPVRS